MAVLSSFRECKKEIRSFRKRSNAAESMLEAASTGYLADRRPLSPSLPMSSYTISINGQKRTVDVSEDTPLLWVLRDHLALVGTKYGCGKGLCGACTIHLNGAAMRSCQLPISSVGDSEITTIEGLAEDGKLTSVQKAWIQHDVPQCGYCQAGQIMSATALLSSKSSPNDSDIDSAMSGNLCRCGTYTRIREAIHTAAKNS